MAHVRVSVVTVCLRSLRGFVLRGMRSKFSAVVALGTHDAYPLFGQCWVSLARAFLCAGWVSRSSRKPSAWLVPRAECSIRSLLFAWVLVRASVVDYCIVGGRPHSLWRLAGCGSSASMRGRLKGAGELVLGPPQLARLGHVSTACCHLFSPSAP